ncbi:HAD superfamily hydrolase (TIGR01484 family) [Ornithinibacillus bavariensis]
MTYKILFLDIDGTILNPDHTYHPKTKEAIEQVRSQGIEVFLATGRPENELKEIADELNIES